MSKIADILAKTSFDKKDLITLLEAQGEELKTLYRKAAQIKREQVGDRVYFRGLVEFSNVCAKNCLYCGIRKDNIDVERYNLSDEEIVQAAVFAWENNYASIVMQSGELMNLAFIDRIDNLLKQIQRATQGELHITLSCGEQSRATYQRWFDSGAHRYLLRVESSNKALYEKIHPVDALHSYDSRLLALKHLQEVGYQTGTGVMIGLPFQSIEDLADDLIFMRDFDIDMVGMGPYIEHHSTPLFAFREYLLSQEERLQLTFKMIAILRIMMKDINIASATALQAIDKVGREKAIKVGANVIMPNITPGQYRDDYLLYDNKPCTDESAEDCTTCLEARITLADNEVALGEWGDSIHYKKRRETK